MTAIVPERAAVLDELPPIPKTAKPVLLPDLLAGVGLTERRVPRWINDPALIESILAGFIEIPDDLNPHQGDQ